MTKNLAFIIKVEEYSVNIQKEFLATKTGTTAVVRNLEEGLEVLKVCYQMKSSQQKTKEKKDTDIIAGS